jgi:hypothetical protein
MLERCVGRRPLDPPGAALALLLTLALLLLSSPAALAAEPAPVAPTGRVEGAFDRIEVVAAAAAGPRVVEVGSLIGIACEGSRPACAHPGFARLGRAASSADGSVVAFVGDRGKGSAVFASIDDGRGTRSLEVIAGERWDQGSRSCRAPELGLGPRPTSQPLCFAALDLDGRVAVTTIALGPPGIAGDSLTFAFAGKPSAASRDDVSTTLPFTGQPGIWTVTIDVPLLEENAHQGGNDDGRCDAEESCRWQFRRAAARPVVQVGQSVDGRSIARLAIEALHAAGAPAAPATLRPRPGAYGLTARAITASSAGPSRTAPCASARARLARSRARFASYCSREM